MEVHDGDDHNPSGQGRIDQALGETMELVTAHAPANQLPGLRVRFDMPKARLHLAGEILTQSWSAQ